jgi:hypothetical protein
LSSHARTGTAKCAGAPSSMKCSCSQYSPSETISNAKLSSITLRSYGRLKLCI